MIKKYTLKLSSDIKKRIEEDKEFAVSEGLRRALLIGPELFNFFLFPLFEHGECDIRNVLDNVDDSTLSAFNKSDRATIFVDSNLNSDYIRVTITFLKKNWGKVLRWNWGVCFRLLGEVDSITTGGCGGYFPSKW